MNRTRIFPFLLILPAIAVYRLSPAVQLRISILYLIVISATTYTIYWHDKRRARNNGRRTPETTLHILEFIGGWPAAFIAQQKLHHKNAKRRYQFTFWGIILLHQYLAIEMSFRWPIARGIPRLFG